MKIKNILPAAFLTAAMLLTGCAGGTESGSRNNSSTSSSSSSKVSSSSSSSKSNINIYGDKTETKAGFSVDGNKLLDANGKEFIMRGVNFPYMWNKDSLEDALDGIAASGANCVRIGLSDGELWEKTTAEEVEKIISECEERKLVSVLEIHDTTYGLSYEDADGNKLSIRDNIKPLDMAANYWIEMADLLNSHADTVIVNIGNEWHNGSWLNSQEWADGYKTIIAKLRSANITNTLMVDADGNGQFAGCLYGDEAKNTPACAADIISADKKSNTMFSIHMFAIAAPDEETVNSTLTSCIDQKICVCVGAFNSGNASASAASQAVMEVCEEKNIGYIGWVWKDDSGNTKNTDIAIDWNGSAYTDWGETLINGSNGIKSASEICSVFE